MSLTPNELRKVTFKRKLSGYDPVEVDNLLAAVAEEVNLHLAERDKLDRENRYYRQRLQEALQRESQLQDTLLHLQKVSDQIKSNAEREGALLHEQARHQADQLVTRAMDEAARIEGKVAELRTARRELYLRFKQTLDFFNRVLEMDEGDLEQGGTVRTFTRSSTLRTSGETG